MAPKATPSGKQLAKGNFGDDRRQGPKPTASGKQLAKGKFGDDRRGSMAPKASKPKPGSNYGPGKIPAAGKPNQGKFDTVTARTEGLAKQGLIKGQPSGAGLKKPAAKKGPVDPGNIIKKKPVSQPAAKKPMAKPAAKPAATSGGGGGRMIAN
jgi:hypothetical protein